MRPLETRLSLIVSLKCEQDELAWRDFVGQHEKFLQQIVRRQGVPEALVPDAIQQILMAISRSLETWKDDGNPGSFRRWMHTVARHVVIRFMTRERKQTAAAGGSDPLGLLNAIESPPDKDLLQRYEHELIVWAAGSTNNPRYVVTQSTQSPVANFTSPTPIIVVGQTAQFYDLSTNNPSAWNWLVEREQWNGSYTTVATSTQQKPNI